MMGDRAGRWFHTLVVVGTAMTACGGSTAVDARPSSDAGRDGAQPVVGGKDSGSSEAGASGLPDASPAGDASAAPDAAAIVAMCCNGTGAGGFPCRLGDAGLPICGMDVCCTYCGCIQ
jgi:hypothetical protein